MKNSPNSKRNEIQKQGWYHWDNRNCRGLLAMATGVGKSKIAVDEAKRQYSIRKNAFKALLVVPTEKLRDNNWKDEFEKWKGKTVWNKVERICYASLAKIKGNHYDFIILDEAHYITLNNSVFFDNNRYDTIMALTATPPSDPVKQALLDRIAPTIFRYTLAQAVKDGLAAPFKIVVIQHALDIKTKNIKSGSKAKPFMQTEVEKYAYLTKRVGQLMAGDGPVKAKTLAALTRMHFIYNLPSKLRIAKRLIAHHMKGRYLVFCSNIAQAETLCAPDTFHSKRDSVAFDKFLAEKIDSLGVVKAVNEGLNIPNLDMALIVQLNSKELDVIQRIGRVVRFRPGHTATIYIIIALGTKDVDWLKQALSGFDENIITYKTI